MGTIPVISTATEENSSHMNGVHSVASADQLPHGGTRIHMESLSAVSKQGSLISTIGELSCYFFLSFCLTFIIKRSGDFHMSRAFCTGNSSMAFTHPEFSRGEVMEWPGKLEQRNKAPWPEGIHLGLPEGNWEVCIYTTRKPGACSRPPQSLKPIFKIKDVMSCRPLV